MDTIHGLDNHPELKKNIDMLKQRLDEYSNNQCDYGEVALSFAHTLDYMLDECMKEYPECIGKDRDDQIDNLSEGGYLTDDQAKTLRDMKQVSDADANSYAARKSYRELKQIYDDLCNFLPSFLNWFFRPSEKEIPAYTPGDESKNRRARKKNTRSHSHRMNRRTRRLVVYFAILLVIIVAWSAMLYEGHQYNEENETANLWDDWGINQGEIVEDVNAEHYAIGETWTVEGQWEFTIENVTSTPYTYSSDDTYGLWGIQESDQEYQMITISYSYTNLGYESNYGTGLSMSLSSARIVDSNGEYAQQIYLNTDITSPPAVAVGETGEAQQEFLVGTDVHSATITYTPESGETAIFDLEWGEVA